MIGIFGQAVTLLGLISSVLNLWDDVSASSELSTSYFSLDGKGCMEGTTTIFQMSDGESVILQGSSIENQLKPPYDKCSAILLPHSENKKKHIKLEFLALSIKNCGVRLLIYSSSSLAFTDARKDKELTCGDEVPRSMFSDSKDCLKIILEVDPKSTLKEYYFFIINASLVNTYIGPTESNSHFILTVTLCTLAGVVAIIIIFCVIKYEGKKIKRFFGVNRSSRAMNNARMFATSFASVNSDHCGDLNENSSQHFTSHNSSSDINSHCPAHDRQLPVRSVTDSSERISPITDERALLDFQPRSDTTNSHRAVLYFNHEANNLSLETEGAGTHEESSVDDIHPDIVVSQIVDDGTSVRPFPGSTIPTDIHPDPVVCQIVDTTEHSQSPPFHREENSESRGHEPYSADEPHFPLDMPPSYDEALHMPLPIIQTSMETKNVYPLYQNM